ncbi:MAG: tetratricopeptide repeat protein, partial [Myxococcales bacterium]|nr:tetratricopeptide repeat protein [Myxococcales bacterium]
LDEMYPSVAMLPSQEQAALAYAEVETMLGLLLDRRGPAGIETLLDRVAMGDDAKDALATAWGDDFEAFMEEWKAVTRRATAHASEEPLRGPEFKDGTDGDAAEEPLGDVFSHLGGGKARQHARLGGLLQGRGHDVAAALQYEKARAAYRRAREDPVLSRRLGKLYVELERWASAVPLLQRAAQEEPEDANLAAAQGRALLRVGDPNGAREALLRAIRVNPFIPTLHCDLAQLAEDEERRAHETSHCRE